MIYFISLHDFVKIGYTIGDPNVRLGELQIGSPFVLKLERVIEGTKRQERWIHKYFYQHYITGEWFHYVSEMSYIVPPPPGDPRWLLVNNNKLRPKGPLQATAKYADVPQIGKPTLAEDMIALRRIVERQSLSKVQRWLFKWYIAPRREQRRNKPFG